MRRGRDARAKVSRKVHGEWVPAPATAVTGRGAQGAGREPRLAELIPIRHARMTASPFAFYRGAAAVMAEDLSATPDSGLRVQCCGDVDLSNFGGFVAPDRTMVFDINDFDETVPGPWEWDVKRLVGELRDRRAAPVGSTRSPAMDRRGHGPRPTGSRCASTRSLATSRSCTAASTSHDADVALGEPGLARGA